MVRTLYLDDDDVTANHWGEAHQWLQGFPTTIEDHAQSMVSRMPCGSWGKKSRPKTTPGDLVIMDDEDDEDDGEQLAYELSASFEEDLDSVPVEE